MKRKWLMALPTAILALLFSAGMVFAVVAEPTDTPTILLPFVRVNRNLITDGDMLIYGDYNIPYVPYTSALPSQSATDTYVIQLLDGDTLIGSVAPFTFMDNGYNRGAFGFYLDAGVSWNTTYTIRICQNPAFFTTPLSWNYVMPITAYTSSTSQEINQFELGVNIIALANRLNTAYLGRYAFTDTSSGGTVLSSPTGETYFRGAISGIQAMAPNLYLVQALNIVSSKVYGTSKFVGYQSRYNSTWVGSGANATANQFGVAPSLAMSLLIGLPLCLGAIILSAFKFKTTIPGFVVCFVIFDMLALMGWFSLALFAVFNQTAGIYLAYVVFYSRG